MSCVLAVSLPWTLLTTAPWHYRHLRQGAEVTVWSVTESEGRLGWLTVEPRQVQVPATFRLHCLTSPVSLPVPTLCFKVIHQLIYWSRTRWITWVNIHALICKVHALGLTMLHLSQSSSEQIIVVSFFLKKQYIRHGSLSSIRGLVQSRTTEK